MNTNSVVIRRIMADLQKQGYSRSEKGQVKINSLFFCTKKSKKTINPKGIIHEFSSYLFFGWLVSIYLLTSGCGGGSNNSSQTYKVDARLKPTQCEFSLHPIINTESPVITLNGLSVVDHPLNSPYYDLGATADDPSEEDLSDKIITTGLDSVDVNQVGDYLIRYNVTNNNNLVARETVRLVRVNAGDYAQYTSRNLGETSSGEGYIERLPVSYSSANSGPFPLIIYLHGSGEVGADLSLLYKSNGNNRDIVNLIEPEQGEGTQHFIVLFPQRCANVVVADEIRSFINYAINTYKVDAARIYLVGLSAGATQIWKYLEVYQDQVAAAVTLAGVDTTENPCAFKDVPLWAFHSEDDPNVAVNNSIDLVSKLNDCSPQSNEKAKLTVFKTGGHVIDETVLPLINLGEGISKYDLYNPDIYSWLLQHNLKQ